MIDEARADSRQTIGKRLNGSTPVLFIVVVLAGLLAAAAYGQRTRGIFACQAEEPGSRFYLAYCQATGFGDYDHGAFWFGLEPDTIAVATSARVLFIGNSRMQFALSGPALGAWFDEHAIDYYLLGFSHMENQTFTAPLLERIRPAAKAYVVNVDYFFEERPSPPGRDVATDAEAPTRYREKRRWMAAHRMLCGAVAALCGRQVAFYRNRDTGSWIRIGGDFAKLGRPVTYDDTVDPEVVRRYARVADEVLAGIRAAGGCVILTNTPQSGTSAGTAAALADELGLPFVAPRLDGLSTFDGSHLDVASAERWSAALIELLGPGLESCLAGSEG